MNCVHVTRRQLCLLGLAALAAARVSAQSAQDLMHF